MSTPIFTMPTIDRVKSHPRFNQSMDARKVARWLENRFRETVQYQQSTGRWTYRFLHKSLKGCSFDHSMMVDIFAEMAFSYSLDETRSGNFFTYGIDGLYFGNEEL